MNHVCFRNIMIGSAPHLRDTRKHAGRRVAVYSLDEIRSLVPDESPFITWSHLHLAGIAAAAAANPDVDMLPLTNSLPVSFDGDKAIADFDSEVIAVAVVRYLRHHFPDCPASRLCTLSALLSRLINPDPYSQSAPYVESMTSFRPKGSRGGMYGSLWHAIMANDSDMAHFHYLHFGRLWPRYPFLARTDETTDGYLKFPKSQDKYATKIGSDIRPRFVGDFERLHEYDRRRWYDLLVNVDASINPDGLESLIPESAEGVECLVPEIVEQTAEMPVEAAGSGLAADPYALFAARRNSRLILRGDVAVD